jgi:hypothetical protein
MGVVITATPGGKGEQMGDTYILRKGVAELDDLADGYLALGPTIGAKSVYYVEGNAGNDSNSGLSWPEAFKTLAVALAASHADISSGSTGWAARNVIYLKADPTAETLTALAQKTTVIGVGSTDGIGSARVTGAHTISGTYSGMHFVNVDFLCAAGATTIFTLPTGVSGIEFHGCRFLGSAAANVAAIKATAVHGLVVDNCQFIGHWADAGTFTTAAIDIATGTANQTQIQNSTFQVTGTGLGIRVNAGRSGANSFIRDNLFMTAAMAIDENSDTFYVADNRIIVGVNAAAGTSVDIPDLLSVNNLVTGSDGNTLPVPAFNSGFGA